MAWRDRLDDPTVHEYAYLTIEGTPYLFTSQELPAAMVPVGYEQIVCLDLSRGIEVKQSPLERKSGVASPQPFSIKLGPRNAERLLQVCAPQGASWRSKLTADFDYNDTRLYCTTAGGPTAGEFVYIGREACEVQSVNAAYFELTNTTHREELDSVQWSFRSTATKYVSDAPEIYEGRLARVWTGFCDDAGDPLDAALYGDNQAEVYVGRIESLSVADDWYSWDMRLQGLESMLDVQIGGEDIGGYLHQFGLPSLPSDKISPLAAYTQGKPPPGLDRVYVTATDAGGTSEIVVDLWGVSSSKILYAVADEIQSALNLDGTLTSQWVVFADYYIDDDYEDVDENSPKWFDIFRHSITITSDYASATASLVDGPKNYLVLLGFNPTDLANPKSVTLGPGAAWEFSASGSPIALYVGKNSDEVQVFVYEIDRWPDSGYIRLGSDEDAEIVRFSTKAPDYTDHIYTVSIEERGALGTKAREISIPFEAVTDQTSGSIEYVRVAGDVEVSVFAGSNQENILAVLLSVVCSTGTAGVRSATYDVANIYAGFGGSIRLDIFDVDRFESLINKLPAGLTVRSMAWQKTTLLRSWLSDELSFLGLTLQARRLHSGRFKLTLDRVAEPVRAVQNTLTTADLVASDGVKIQRVSRGIVNQMTAQTMWNPATQDWEDRTWEINDVDSQEIYGKRPPMQIRAKGMAAIDGAGKTYVEQRILSVMSHYSRPYELVTFSASRSGWRYQPGDQIALTHAGIPNYDGTRGWTDEPLIVMAASANYIGKGRKVPTKLVCLHLGDRLLSYYVPSALISSYDAPSKTLTLAANEFSDAAIPFPLDSSVLCKDIRWFDLAGSDILIANEGDEANQEKQTIAVAGVDVDAGTITLTAALTLTPGARAVIFYPDYDDCDATQKLYVHLADNNAQLGAANDDAFQYSG
jgi:hypothetical protein